MKLIILESPYSGEVQRNLTYARRAMRHSLEENEVPIAFHLIYTQEGILDDTQPEQREWGIRASQEWYFKAAMVVAYTDYGITPGMKRGIEHALQHEVPIIYRQIGTNPRGTET